ncbi:HNHc domain containing protein [uncultured Caudovirales phage]|uniref:HNHc domain containing protein n=1 Tax=uncultured Caudovirales phage TaxID=2100421 RepID=A0A6J5M6X7_9CAUD|nr:HNHc domain containing protein [uncultured Caudovirales phage]
MTSAPIPAPEKRKALTKWEFATLFLAQGGKCAVCGSKLENGKTRDEHIHSLYGGGGNELSNRQLWCLDCTKPKDKADKARHAKIDRLTGKTGNGPKRKIPPRPMAKAKPQWPKRKFNTRAER